MEATYSINIEGSGSTWSAWSDEMSVFVTADSREHLITQAREAIEFAIESYRQLGRELPNPKTVETVPVAVKM